MNDSNDHDEHRIEENSPTRDSGQNQERTSTPSGSRRTDTPERNGRWFVPKTTAGKVLLALYLLSLGAVSLSVLGVAFSEPRLIGPVPEVVAWTYAWFGMMNVVLLGTYVYLFKPWAETVTEYVDYKEPEPPVRPGVTDNPPEDSPVKAGELE